MRARICHYPGCDTLIQPNETYCGQHIRPPSIPFENAVRSNNYNTTQWRRLRKKILKEQPNCSRCGSTENLQVHHIIPPRGNEDLFYDESNLTTICATCHRVITNQEIRKRHK
jgi:5-methylcytosine-specific restriction protein A